MALERVHIITAGLLALAVLGACAPAAPVKTAAPSASTAPAPSAAHDDTGLPPHTHGPDGKIVTHAPARTPVTTAAPDRTGLNAAAGAALLAAFNEARAAKGAPACAPDAETQAQLEKMMRDTFAGADLGTSPPKPPAEVLRGLRGNIIVSKRTLYQHPWAAMGAYVDAQMATAAYGSVRACYAVVVDAPAESAVIGLWVKE